MKNADFETIHPRDFQGRFIEKGAIVQVRGKGGRWKVTGAKEITGIPGYEGKPVLSLYEVDDNDQIKAGGKELIMAPKDVRVVKEKKRNVAPPKPGTATGARDKNGSEIKVGDVVTTPASAMTERVEGVGEDGKLWLDGYGGGRTARPEEVEIFRTWEGDVPEARREGDPIGTDANGDDLKINDSVIWKNERWRIIDVADDGSIVIEDPDELMTAVRPEELRRRRGSAEDGNDFIVDYAAGGSTIVQAFSRVMRWQAALERLGN